MIEQIQIKSSLTSFTSETVKKQRIKYVEELNEKIKQNQNISSLSNYKTPIPTLNISQTLHQFISAKSERQQSPVEEKNKIKNKIVRLKQIQNNEPTWQKTREGKDGTSLQNKLSEDLSQQWNEMTTRTTSREVSVKSQRVKSYQKSEKITRGNAKQYLKDLKRYLKIKTGCRLERIEEKTEETSILSKQLPRQKKQLTNSKHSSTDDSESSFKKTPRNIEILTPCQSSILPKIGRSPSLPQIQNSKINQSPRLFSRNKPERQQCLELKLRLPSLQKIKPSLKHSTQIIRESNLKSMEMEKRLAKQLNEFKKLQLIEKQTKVKETKINKGAVQHST